MEDSLDVDADLFLFQQAVKNKYARSKLMKISLVPHLKSSVLMAMAAPLLND